MIGVVFKGHERLELKEFPDPTPGPRDVVVEVRASGMCGSDLHLYRGDPGPGGYATMDGSAKPIIPGHEPSGVVVERGSALSAADIELGKRVAVFHYRGCGHCPYCWSGRPQLCRQTVGYGGTAHGGHARFLVVPVETLVILPESMSFAAGACIACGTGTAYGALRCLPRLSGETVVIVGQGPVGLSATILAPALGARVIAIEPDPDRRAAAARLGAHVVLDPARDPIDEAVAEQTGGLGATAVVETSGSTAGRRTAIASSRPEGAVVLVGLGGGHLELDLDRELVMAPRAFIGSRTFSLLEMRACIELVDRRGLPVDALVTAVVPLARAADAYATFARGSGSKFILDPSA